MPDTGVAKIYASQSGIVLDKYVEEGQTVRRGQLLYTVSSDRLSQVNGETQVALIEQARLRKT